MKHIGQSRQHKLLSKLTVVVTLTSLLCLLSASRTPAENAPARPALAALDYPHASVRVTKVGDGASSCTVFEPDEPHPDTAPLVYFTHGFMATETEMYEGWLKHLARSGSVVIHATYQGRIALNFRKFPDNLCIGIRAGLDFLNTEGHVRPREDAAFAVGHSLGGLLSAYLSVNAREKGFPVPKACFCVEPGGYIEENNLMLPEQTLFVSLFASDDSVVGSRLAKSLFEKYRIHAPKRTALVEMLTDRHGEPALSADHFTPVAMVNPKRYLPPSSAIDGHDSGYLWKMFDRLCSEAMKDKPDLRNALVFPLPKWSDGFEITPPRITFSDGSIYPLTPLKVTSEKSPHKSDTCREQLIFRPVEAGAYPSVLCVVDSMESQFERLAIKRLLSAIAARGFICEYMEIVQRGEIDISGAIVDALDNHDELYKDNDAPTPADWGLIVNSGALKHSELLLPRENPPACGVLITTGFARQVSKDLNLCQWLIVGDRQNEKQANQQAEFFGNIGIKAICHNAWTEENGYLDGLGKVGDDASVTALQFLAGNIQRDVGKIRDPHLLRR